MSSLPDGRRLLRVLVAVIVAGLLGGTAAALALTEQLKLERSPVLRTHVGKLLGLHGRIPIDFALRKADRLTVVIVDSKSREVRTLLSSTLRPRGVQRFNWDGRDDAGQMVAAGIYKPRVHLAREHRTILMPNPIQVDPVAPRIALVSLTPRVLSPDGDYRGDVLRIHYRTSERARALLYVNGQPRAELRRYALSGLLRWGGKRFGQPLPAGRYRLALRARDLAGNLSPLVPIGSVRIRYIEVRPHILHAKPGARIGFRVSTDTKRFNWRFGSSGGGRSRPGLLVLRAPAAPGRYRLVVSEKGHTATALLIVGAA
jgi:flagellar hook capping protein FlgD